MKISRHTKSYTPTCSIDGYGTIVFFSLLDLCKGFASGNTSVGCRMYEAKLPWRKIFVHIDQ